MRRLRTAIALVATASLAALTMATSSASAATSVGAAGADGGDAATALAQGNMGVTWKVTPTGTLSRFRGLAPVSKKVAWVSGTEGSVLRTIDGGRSWQSVGPTLSAADAALQFRDIEAFSADNAVIMSIGNGPDSRIYVTSDGGKTWTMTFQNERRKAFYDCMAFSSPTQGYAVSDPVDGKFRIIETTDGGHSWKVLDKKGMVPALDGEAGFAASGTCLATGKNDHVYLGTGGVNPGRILTSADGGLTWTAVDSPIAGGPASGVFSVQYRNAFRGIAVGGDYTNVTQTGGDSAYTADGGQSWHESAKAPAGYRSGSAWVAPTLAAALAVGPTGSDLSLDNGKTWQLFDSGSFDSVECTADLACWASGDQGRVGKLVLK